MTPRLDNAPRCACGSTSYDVILAGTFNRLKLHEFPFTVATCVDCGLARSFPVPDPDVYEHGFTLSTDDGRFVGSTTDAWSARIANYVGRRTRGRRLLDVGCHTGALVEAATELGLQAEGIDIDPIAVDAGQRLGRPIRTARIEDVDGTFDAVVVNHVLEHVVDVEGFLGGITRVLAPAGRVFVFVPHYRGLTARVMGTSWIGWAPNHHVWHFTPGTLERTVATVSPLQVVGSSTRGVVEPRSTGAKGAVKDVIRQAARALRWGDQLEAILERAPAKVAA